MKFRSNGKIEGFGAGEHPELVISILNTELRETLLRIMESLRIGSFDKQTNVTVFFITVMEYQLTRVLPRTF
jgi:hypothetical protein